MTFALVDGNNFFVSCKRVFNPALEGRPVVVLSNNDGCVVARSAEVRALSVKMGAPWFQLQDLARRHGIVAYSSNYELYADMSNRVMAVLAQFSPRQEIYSIDECFLDWAGFDPADLQAYGETLRAQVKRCVGIPVCVGIAATKTLAKLANHCAKKSLAGTNGVCDFSRLAAGEVDALLARLPVGEVWGIGRELARRLNDQGIINVRDLRDADLKSLRRRYSMVLERTVMELRGVSCLALEELAPAKQQIMCSRSFGQAVYSLPELEKVVATYTARAAEKLRKQGSFAGAVQVFIRTNPFREDLPQYPRGFTLPQPASTGGTRTLTRAALGVLRHIYRSGYAYQKAGVMLIELDRARQTQAALFDHPAPDRPALMRVIDQANARWGRGTLGLAAEGIGRAWRMRRQRVSPAYTTRWSDLPRVR